MFPFLTLNLGVKTKIIQELCLESTNLNDYVDYPAVWTNVVSFHNCAREIPLVQSVLSGCHSLPRIQYVPAVHSAGNYSSDLEVNCTSPSSAVADNA
jgi:hypothetical protein